MNIQICPNITSNNFVGGYSLSKSLKFPQAKLSNLCLHDCHIDEYGLLALSSELLNYNKYLIQLVVSCNQSITDLGWSTISFNFFSIFDNKYLSFPEKIMMKSLKITALKFFVSKLYIFQFKVRNK